MINDDSFWTRDIALFAGTFRYHRNKKRPVRGKLHVSEEKYDFYDFGHALEASILKTRHGTRSYVLMHPYVIEPNLIMTVAIDPKRYVGQWDTLGKTAGTRVEGYQDVGVGNAQAWYYPEDRVLVLWECFLDSFVRGGTPPEGQEHGKLVDWV